jgi:hypothetical protein
MLRAHPHASDSGAIPREGRTLLGAKFKLLCSEIAVSETALNRSHVHIRFLLRMTNTLIDASEEVGL